MKAILRYDLTDPDDKREFELACKAEDYQMFVWDFSQEILRKYYKYGVPNELTDATELLSHIRKEFIRLFNEYKLDDPI